MEELNMDLPEGFLTPEERVRFNKMQSDVKAFYEQHGNHFEWLEQAAELGLMEVKDLTPDDKQYMEAVAKMAKKYNFGKFEAMENVQSSIERMERLAYLRSEAMWFQNLITRKRIESGKNLIAHMKLMLADAEDYRVKRPHDKQIGAQIEKLKSAIEALTTQTTASDLSTPVREGLADNWWLVNKYRSLQ